MEATVGIVHSPRADAPPWNREDLISAVAELRREFPASPVNRLEHAVNNAACILSSNAGRVKLLQEARKRVFREQPARQAS